MVFRLTSGTRASGIFTKLRTACRYITSLTDSDRAMHSASVAQGPSRTCNESKEEEEEASVVLRVMILMSVDPPATWT